jgi:hypothetical protein
MKKLFPFAIAAFLIATNAFGSFRSAVITTSAGYKIGYEFGNVQTNVSSTSSKKPGGDYWYQPFGVKSPINNSIVYPSISDYTSTLPFTIDALTGSISFDFVETISDMMVASSADLCSVTSARVEVVDASTGEVLATPYVSTPFCNSAWINGQFTGHLGYSVPGWMVGKTVVVRMVVAWTGSNAVSFNAFETDHEFTLGYSAILGGAAKYGLEASADLQLSNSPNPASSQTVITFQGVVNPVALHVYDMLGREVADLSSSLGTIGSTKSVTLNTSSLAAGRYIYRLSTETGAIQKTLIVKH